MANIQKNILGFIIILLLIFSLTAAFYFAKFKQPESEITEEEQNLLLEDNINDVLEAIKVLEDLGGE